MSSKHSGPFEESTSVRMKISARMKPTPLHWNLSHSYRSLPQAFFSDAQPARFPRPRVLLFNQPLARELGLLLPEDTTAPDASAGADARAAAHPATPTPWPADAPLMVEAADIFSGNRFPEGSQPLSQAYAGHQFGHFAMLGDGRATLIGEQITPDGQRVDIQLKGNGQTPYSRQGDGKAALGPMLREYLISEAMHALHIPTTRSLAVVTTGDRIHRRGPKTGAVLTRTAQSHIRVATFQYAAALRDVAALKALADYTIERHFPDIHTETAENPQLNPYRLMLRRVITRQVALVAQWQSVGFIHGVMNTDNMAIAGETIDYGPCAFMDTYDPDTVFSSIDHQGRYRYSNQPPIAHWNLTRLAETLLPLFSDDQDEAVDMAKEELNAFASQFEACYTRRMCQKLGLFSPQDAEVPASDQLLAIDLLQLMLNHEADYTNTFVRLTLAMDGQEGRDLDGTEPLFSTEAFSAWKTRWHARLDEQAQSRQEAAARMKSANPFVIPRNALVEAALETAEARDMQPFNALLSVLQSPFDPKSNIRAYQGVPKDSREYMTFCGT